MPIKAYRKGVQLALIVVSLQTYAASKPRRGMSPSSVAPRQQRFRRGRRRDAPRPENSAFWREAAPRWHEPDEPSGDGNGRGARAGEEQRYAGTSPAVAGIAGPSGLAFARTLLPFFLLARAATR